MATGEIIGNPYNKDGWKYAWVCTNGVWDNTKHETGAEIPEGEGIVVAKIYETGRKITPPDLNFEGTTYTYTEENEYVMVIEGEGEMGALMELDSEGNPVGMYAWLMETMLFMLAQSEKCTIPYVSEIIVCDGVKNICDRAFGYGTGLKKVIISKDVTSIGTYAFVSCTNLTNIAIPDSVTSIGDAAFSICSSLTNITIPDSVTSIGEYAFYDCSSLTNVTIGNSVTSIGDGAFARCTNLKNVTIGNSVKSIGISAFLHCSSLINITIPDSVTSVGGSAFQGCTRLSEITIPNGVIEIGPMTFYECSNLKNVTIGTNVTSIIGNSFYGCSNLITVTINSESIAESITSSEYLIKNATTLYINENIEETSIGSYITENYNKSATSDKAGYVKYTKK